MNLATLAQETAADPNGTRDMLIGIGAVLVVLGIVWWILGRIF